MLLLGIDPGTTTGLAHWSVAERALTSVQSMSIHRAMDLVRELPKEEVLVLFEDARLRNWFGAKGREALQGAGSIKRDCVIWEDFLTDHSIPFLARKPAAGATKWSAEAFQRVTGWKGRTNEHARDAAALVYGLTPTEVQILMLKTAHGAGESTCRNGSSRACVRTGTA